MRFILFILLSSTLSYSQLLDGEISIMYSGEQLFHPGFKIAIDHDLYVKTKTKGKKEKQITRSKGYSLFSGTYLHPHNNFHLYLGSNYYIKRTNHKGRSCSIQLGLGAGRVSFLQPTYTLENGSLSKVHLAGRWTVFPNLKFQLTYPSNFILDGSSLKLGFWNQYQFPYNNRGAYIFGFDLGLVLPNKAQ